MPVLLTRWAEGLLGGPIPPETRANCDECSMCLPLLDADPREIQFFPGVKCCTYIPSLPNFIVGMILDSSSAADATARAEVERRVASSQAATPWKLESSRRTRVQYMKIQREDLFGRTESLVCPYWVNEAGGKCGIWRYRIATCATWFCRYSRYAVGRRFWLEIGSVLCLVEDSVSSWCLLELGLDANCLIENHDAHGDGRQLALGEFQGWQDPDGQLHSSLDRRLWGSWQEKKQELYGTCARLAAALTWKDIQAICGVRLTILEARLRASLAALYDVNIPESLCLTDIERTPTKDGKVAIRSAEMPFESLELDDSAADLLPLFDGRPTEQVLQDAGERGAVLDEELIRLLFEQGVLAKVDHKDIPTRGRNHPALHPKTQLFFFRDFRESEVRSELRPGEDGQLNLHIQCGPKQIVFDDPDLFEFARKLFLYQNGFYAGDAVHWGPPGVTYSWDRVCEILKTLIDEDILQVLGPGEG